MIAIGKFVVEVYTEMWACDVSLFFSFRYDFAADCLKLGTNIRGLPTLYFFSQ